MGKVVSFINYKGGVGKTTTAYHIGCALSMYHNKKVLLIDTDPQTNLTFLCAIPQRWEQFRDSHGTISNLFNAYLNDTLDKFQINSIIWESPIKQGEKSTVPDIDLIPSDVVLLGLDIDLAAKTRRKNERGFYQEQVHIFRQTIKKIKEEFGISTSHDMRDALFYAEQRQILKCAIATVKDAYDYILIDCPPNLYLVTQNAIVASDCFIITTIPDHLSTVGINILNHKIRELNYTLSEKLHIAGLRGHPVDLRGILFTMVSKSGPGVLSVHSDKMQLLRKEYGNLCFKNYILRGAGYIEAAARALPVFLLSDSNSMRVASQYREVTKEFLEKIEGGEICQEEPKDQT